MYSALSIRVLFILRMQLVNGAQFLNITFLLVLNESVALATLKSTILPLLFTVAVFLQYCYKLLDVFQ